MYNCKTHGWSSFQHACPMCHPTITTSTNIQVEPVKENKEVGRRCQGCGWVLIPDEIAFCRSCKHKRSFWGYFDA